MQRLACLVVAMSVAAVGCTRANPGIDKAQNDLAVSTGGNDLTVKIGTDLPLSLDLPVDDTDLPLTIDDLAAADDLVATGGDDLTGVPADDLTSVPPADLTGVSPADLTGVPYVDMVKLIDQVAPGDLCDVCISLAAGATGTSSTCAATCAECSGTSVCGDGANYGTAVDTQYACGGNGMLGKATKCALGCNVTTGACHDLVPASQAASHLDTSGPAADTFTCTGAQAATLPAIVADAGSTLTINTTAKTIARKGGTLGAATFNARWGTVYKPSVTNNTTTTNGTTNTIVAHVASLTASGATITVIGTNALVLLVDDNVAITSTGIDASGHGLITVGVTASGKGGNGEGGGGGGGGGHGDVGGKGGAFGDKVGAAGGAMFGDIVWLEAGGDGGSGGGASVSASGASGFGGIGGGAVQITACKTIAIDDKSLLNASGGFGIGGAPNQQATATGGGGGGGAGGAIILEAATLTIGGELVANGGGGGQGGDLAATGDSGHLWDTTGATTVPAAGGNNVTILTGGVGGSGFAQGSAVVAGGPATLMTSGSGGGGGAAGRVFLNVSPLAGKPTVGTNKISPTAKSSRVCVSGSPCTYTFDP